MNLDLHVHSSERSPCATVTAKYQVEAAIQAGLDGIAFTDHAALVPRERLAALNEAYAPFRIFTGIEINAGHNDWLVLGIHDLALERSGWRYPDLLDFVRGRRGFIILAHPFRRAAEIRDDLATYPPDGIEGQSINTPAERQADIRAVATELGLALFTNSDSHYPGTVGRFSNRLPRPARDDRELLDVLFERKPNGKGREVLEGYSTGGR
jgi:histidinol phosphatase-like PHP family hydrolase